MSKLQLLEKAAVDTAASKDTCTCSKAHMASHNAICKACSEKSA